MDTHPNVFLTLSGHNHFPTGSRTKIGNRNELFFDRQDEDMYRGGATVSVLVFDTVKNTLNVTTYLTYANRYLTDPESQFTLTSVFPQLIPEFSSNVLMTILLAIALLSVVVLKNEIGGKVRSRQHLCTPDNVRSQKNNQYNSLLRKKVLLSASHLFLSSTKIRQAKEDASNVSLEQMLHALVILGLSEADAQVYLFLAPKIPQKASDMANTIKIKHNNCIHASENSKKRAS